MRDRQLTNKSLAKKDFEAHHDTKLHEWVSDPVSVQLLDGLGAGIFGIMQLLVIADLTKGTGHFNLAQGAVATAVAIGASLSNALAGTVAKSMGYDAGFLTMSTIATVALIFFWYFMPETKDISYLGNSTKSLG